MNPQLPARIGFGFDLHRLVAGRPLILAGVRVESPVGCEAHSDGDVVLHALVDAILGRWRWAILADCFPMTRQSGKMLTLRCL